MLEYYSSTDMSTKTFSNVEPVVHFEEMSKEEYPYNFRQEYFHIFHDFGG